METVAIPGTLLVIGGILGGWGVVLILGVLLILLGARHFPDFGRGLRRGINEFEGATKDVRREIRDALESDDGGSPKESGLVYEALTDDNRTVEFVYPQNPPNLTSDLIVFVAQGFGVGRVKFAPGFLGSLVGMGW